MTGTDKDKGDKDAPVTKYTQEDFLTGTAPYEEVYKLHGDPFKESRAISAMEIQARRVGVLGFKGMYQKYVRKLKSIVPMDAQNLSNFSEQPLTLDTGEWETDETGVWRRAPMGGVEIACSHPIMPVERLRNIDTGELKIILAFRRGGKRKNPWIKITTGFDVVSNSKNITQLSSIGISVTSGKRAQNLVDYIADVLDKNYDLIPERKSTSRMGWSEDGFSPYVEDIVFDGNPGFERTFQSISQHGKFEIWKNEAVSIRKNLSAKIVLASSFASVLVHPCGLLPFFVHLWGMDSGTGKTVALMAAASVWAEPTVGGGYIKTFQATSVGFEVIAGFLNSLPVVIDELQLAKDSHGKMLFDVYKLASGAGKLRSNKTLGIAQSLTWANCFLTSGETPITSENDASGAINRVIEIECKADNKVIADGHKTAGIMKSNYGFAGRKFIEHLAEGGELDNARALYEKNYTACMQNDTTEKQASAAAIIVTADQLATEWIFQDNNALTVSDMASFLKSKKAVSAADRGYHYICDWVSQNANRLKGGSTETDTYGQIITKGEDAGWVYIIRSVFDKVCEDGKFSPRALLGHLRTKRLIQTRDKGFTKTKRINDVPTDCVVMRLSDYDQFEDVEDGDLPFYDEANDNP